jgi:N-acyl-L-homoserine lactone synthetase
MPTAARAILYSEELVRPAAAITLFRLLLEGKMMAVLVSQANREQHTGLLQEMHQDRKRVFVDKLGWNVPVVDNLYEIDAFDTDEALYLIAVDPHTGAHMASVRLLPTNKPHLMSEVFRNLCDEDVPSGPDIWEMTRLCTAPEVPSAIAPFVRGRLLLSLFEIAIEQGITKVTAVCHLKFLSTLLSVGWDCMPLGLPREVDGEIAGAILIHVNAEALAILRDRFGAIAAA